MASGSCGSQDCGIESLFLWNNSGREANYGNPQTLDQFIATQIGSQQAQWGPYKFDTNDGGTIDIGNNYNFAVDSWYDISWFINSSAYVWAYVNGDLQFSGQITASTWDDISKNYNVSFHKTYNQ